MIFKKAQVPLPPEGWQFITKGDGRSYIIDFGCFILNVSYMCIRAQLMNPCMDPKPIHDV